MRVTASRVERITVTAAGVRPNLARRQLAGTLYRVGEVGHTSAGPLRINDVSAIEVPDDFATVGLTLEHDRGVVRGQLLALDDTAERRYVVVRVADGPAGDAALAEAADRTRAAFSFDIEDAEVVDGVIVSGRLAYIGQVAEPAYNSARIDQIAASRVTGASRPITGGTMTAEQRARLAELIAQQNLSDAERAELDQLTQLAVDEAANGQPADQQPADQQPADQQPATATATRQPVAASLPAVPRGVPGPRAQVREPRPTALRSFVDTVVAAFAPGGGGASAITAALADVTNTANPAIEAPGWSGELWSGLQFEPEWSPLFNSGDLTNWEGKGWRWTTKPQMGDYAGDKAAIPSAAIATEPSSYEAARMAVGHDFDRKFFDFPNAAFLESYMAAVREDWAVKLDAKVRAYVLAQAVAYGAATTNLLKAAALALFGVKKNTRARGTFVAVNDTDYLGLLDVNANAVPAFLEQFNVDPAAFIFDENVPAGTVIAGVKQAATVRTLPGSPIRVDAQNLANGGVDEAFFGYWAIEEHHTTGIVKTTFA